MPWKGSYVGEQVEGVFRGVASSGSSSSRSADIVSSGFKFSDIGLLYPQKFQVCFYHFLLHTAGCFRTDAYRLSLLSGLPLSHAERPGVQGLRGLLFPKSFLWVPYFCLDRKRCLLTLTNGLPRNAMRSVVLRGAFHCYGMWSFWSKVSIN